MSARVTKVQETQYGSTVVKTCAMKLPCIPMGGGGGGGGGERPFYCIKSVPVYQQKRFSAVFCVTVLTRIVQVLTVIKLNYGHFGAY